MEKIKKVPERRCIGCGEHRKKEELFRVVKSKDGEIKLDKTMRAAGRGAYVCKNAECLKKAAKARRLEAAFKAPVSSAVYAALEAEMNEGL